MKKKMQKIKENGDIDEEENKIIEAILKGINVLIINSSAEIKAMLTEEIDTLFKLTHHTVFRI